MKLIPRLMLLIGILASGTVLDQGTKMLAKQKLSGGQSYSYFFDSFRLQYSENRGAFLSMFDNIPDPMGSIVLAFVPSVILILLLIYMIASKKMTSVYFIALALIFTCGVNNVFGRIVNHRMVIDFMSFSVGPFFRFT
ncbi:MAG: signal peptidase II, partial [Brevinematales bacterium]